MNKSLVLLASFAGLVACFGGKKPVEGQEGQTTEEPCPAATPAPAPVAELAPAAESKAQ